MINTRFIEDELFALNGVGIGPIKSGFVPFHVPECPNVILKTCVYVTILHETDLHLEFSQLKERLIDRLRVGLGGGFLR